METRGGGNCLTAKPCPRPTLLTFCSASSVPGMRVHVRSMRGEQERADTHLCNGAAALHGVGEQGTVLDQQPRDTQEARGRQVVAGQHADDHVQAQRAHVLGRSLLIPDGLQATITEGETEIRTSMTHW
jgi:hypothetical protein